MACARNRETHEEERESLENDWDGPGKCSIATSPVGSRTHTPPFEVWYGACCTCLFSQHRPTLDQSVGPVLSAVQVPEGERSAQWRVTEGVAHGRAAKWAVS